MTVARDNLASRLSAELVKYGLTCKTVENGFAVAASSASRKATVWLPEEAHAAFVWGKTNEWAAPGTWPLPDVARSIARTLR